MFPRNVTSRRWSVTGWRGTFQSGAQLDYGGWFYLDKYKDDQVNTEELREKLS